MPEDSSDGDPGARLNAQASWLALLLVHLAGRRVRARAEIDDLAQEVYLRALAARDGLPPVEPGELRLRRFLARIARHTVIDLARAIRAHKRAGREVPLARSDWSITGVHGNAIAASAPGPATRAVALESEGNLAAAFGRLSKSHQRVIALRQFEGLTAAETAVRMARSETAVHSLYRRALLAWRDQAGDEIEESQKTSDESGGGSRSEDS